MARSRLRRLLPVLLVFGVLPAAAFGQTATLLGTVTDAENRAPLPGANVVVASGEATNGTAARSDGTFVLRGLSPGTYTITVSFIGYETATQAGFVLVPGEARTLDVALVPGGYVSNPVTVTASRRPEKALDAPAAVTVIEPEQLQLRTALSAAEHLKAVPAVDLISTGINQSRIVIRGFNDNLASSLLTLVDNRIVRIPSIRLTALQLIPLNTADIEQIEVVAGPASALYGPNAANGVVHILTKSPFDAPGTTASLSAGERDVFSGALRHAGTLGDRVGFKVFAQYYEGRDFEFYDPAELDARRLALDGGANPDTLKIGARDFGVRNLAFEGRLDYRLGDDGVLIFNTGLTQGDNIETSPTGAVQTDNARFTYLQARLRYRRLFAQAFLNTLDSGDSFSLRTGDLFRENSRQFVAQVQHAASLGRREHLTYGLDLFLTRPDSKGTVNGRNENRDDVNEAGAYLQSETGLTDRWDLVTAARLDYHNRLGDLTFSPRAALVFKPAPAHTLRATFNRAFQTPAPNHFFADVLGQRDVFEGRRLAPLLGFTPAMDLRVQGTPDDGFHFRRGTDGRPQFRSPYAALDPRGLDDHAFIDLDDPVFAGVMWNVARQAAVAGLAQGLADAGSLAPDQVAPVSAALAALLPSSVTGVGGTLKALDLEAQGFLPAGDPADLPPLGITRTQTVELGYKGLVGRQLLVGLDVYRSRVKNFIGPFLVGTPTVFLDGTSLFVFLSEHLRQAAADPANATFAETLRTLDAAPGVGNGNGTGVDEAAAAVAFGLASAIPFGSVTPEEAFDPTAVVLVRRNFGDITLHGLDARFLLFVTRHWQVGGSYSYVSENLFENADGVDDIALNAPRHKFSVQLRYADPDGVFNGEVRLRRVGGFPVRSDVYFGEVRPYTVIDASAHYVIPFARSTRLTLSVQNLTNNEHREFVDVPKIGRLALLRLTRTF